MDAVNNDTMQAILHLIGPGGVGLLFYCAASTYALKVLFSENQKARQNIEEISEKQINVQNELKNVMEKLLERVK